MLIFSGLGSFWSGGISKKKLYLSIVLVLILLAVHQWFVPLLFEKSISLSIYIKIILTVLTIAPLAFFMGVIFPYILRQSKSVITDSSAGMFFAINAAASALAAPLAISTSTSYGFKVTFGTGMIIYLAVMFLILSINNSTMQKLVGGLIAVIFIGLLVFPFTTGSTYSKAIDGKYEIFGISYGDSKFREDKVFLDGSENKKVSFEWLFWLVKGNGKTILVDTGFDEDDLAVKWNIQNYISPQKQLERLDIRPEDVTDVILTHAHWDHIGSLHLYTNANVWLQQSEYDFIKGLVSEDVSETNGFRYKDLKLLKQIEEEGRLKLASGESIIFNGITLTPGGTHTPGSQYVTIETADGSVIIAGDDAYMYENIRRHKPIGSASDYEANLTTIRDMHKKAASPFFILPGHDPKVLRWFPKVTENIIQITTTEVN